MTTALTRAQLGRLGCGRPGCADDGHDGLYFHGRCHPDAPVQACYTGGVVVLTCDRCGSEAARIAVAR